MLYNEELTGLVATNKVTEREFSAPRHMNQVPSTNRIRIAVDLTPMLLGGANGGVKPAILEFIRALQGLQDPGFDFFFISRPVRQTPRFGRSLPTATRQFDWAQQKAGAVAGECALPGNPEILHANSYQAQKAGSAISRCMT